MLGKMRVLFSIPTRNKKERPTEFEMEISVDGVVRTATIDVADCPSLPIVFPVFELPGILRGEENCGVIRNLNTYTAWPHMPDNEERLARLRKKFGGSFELLIEAETPIGPFIRMLAKIAHAQAVAEYGYESFKPMLRELILGDFNSAASLVGTQPLTEVMDSEDYPEGAHQISLGLVNLRKTSRYNQSVDRYLCASIRLFKDLKTPLYMVIVGVPSESLARKLEVPSHRAGQ